MSWRSGRSIATTVAGTGKSAAMSDWGQNWQDYVDQRELLPGQPCIECGDATTFASGSGKFVNRIFCDHGTVTGYMCAECQEGA